ncbi:MULTISPECIES: helix-turn-helix domain-containing protein [unclassified Streptomyces]|uniref:MmyB family transcriptional regulator n=1 Tax=unclassified Streptomyces TaxID=2593676 RepID=UPI00087F1455|nr:MULTISPECIES: helix-turn-helix domain-containing protein [unclassified Streptomyces]PBC72302.1 helix-turn-helix protein [Streptomyces sp. 2321.6]SDR62243.1 Helix-turn-helix domain-containing protein [Streptomyces sp. KS_16]SEE51309.1 Helix-turn-helix domain-containing protein [Streptomyces sp. 2133.1]SNC77806.1 Helix-turn-helix domain-containing protein [Streptomyces sp. 2114.4]
MDSTALAGLLEARRALIDPATVPGIQVAQNPGRRAAGRGLTQSHVDQMAGYDNNTYNRLINGKIHNPSFKLLRAYANALRLTEQEWVAMCRYARGDDPNSRLHPRSGLEVPGMWKDVIDGSRHMAYITDQSYNLLAHNEPFVSLFAHQQPPPNMMEWMLLSDEARTTLTGWKTVWTPYVLPQLRGARAILPDDETLARIEDAVIKDTECGPLYEERSTAQVHPDGQERPLLHPTLGPCWVQICAAEPLSSPNARVMFVKLNPGADPSQIRRPYLRAAA